jgi:glyceraldehyde 3-phosphate dehydrogenase
MIKVGINGFGRIGRTIFRINQKDPAFQVVALNDLDPNVENLAYLLKYDSTYGRLSQGVSSGKNRLLVNGKPIPFYCKQDISEVPWEKHGVDVVIDATGVRQNVMYAHKVANGVVRKVIITHSPHNLVDRTIIFGVNEGSYHPQTHHVISASICDANAAAPVLKVVDEEFGIESGFVTTLHPWLSYQNLVDGPVSSISSPGHFWNDYSLGRASTHSLIPKGTTLVQALGEVLPSIASKLEAISFRVPQAIVSCSDVTLRLKRRASVDDINRLFKLKAKTHSRIFDYQEDFLVSIDFLATDYSVTVHGRWTRVQNGRNVKLVLWYDNEWGYSRRVVDLVRYLMKKR